MHDFPGMDKFEVGVDVLGDYQTEGLNCVIQAEFHFAELVLVKLDGDGDHVCLVHEANDPPNS